MREDEVRALEELERAWGLRCGPKPSEPRADGRGPLDDGAAPPDFLLIEKSEPNFLLVEQTEAEKYGVTEAPSWAEWAREVRAQLPPLFTTETPWLTALVCVVAALCTTAVLVVALGRNVP